MVEEFVIRAATATLASKAGVDYGHDMTWNHSLIWALLPLAAILEWRVQAVQSLAAKLARAPVRRRTEKMVGEAGEAGAFRAEP